MTQTPEIARIIDDLILREGEGSNDPDDSGGNTRYGVTEAVAREFGYTGRMEDLTRDQVREIYLKKYVVGPGFNRILEINQAVAEELVDTGVHSGVETASKFLQRLLNVFNLRGEYYADLKVDGQLGPATRAALQAYLTKRGAVGLAVLLQGLNVLQGAFLIELAERREKDEKWIWGWLRARVRIL